MDAVHEALVPGRQAASLPLVCAGLLGGEGQMSINALRVGELLADDSNFREPVIHALAPGLAALLALPRKDFKSRWCAGGPAWARLPE